MDIRKFFGQPSKSLAKSPPAVPIVGRNPAEEKRKTSRKRRVVISSSDDSDIEDPVPSKVKKHFSKDKNADTLSKFRHSPEHDEFAKSTNRRKQEASRIGDAKMAPASSREKTLAISEMRHSTATAKCASKLGNVEVIELEGQETVPRERSLSNSSNHAHPHPNATCDRKVTKSKKIAINGNVNEICPEIVEARVHEKSLSSKVYSRKSKHEEINVVTVSSYFNGKSGKKSSLQPATKCAEAVNDSDEEFNDLLEELDEQSSIPSCSSASRTPAVADTIMSAGSNVDKAPKFTGIQPDSIPSSAVAGRKSDSAVIVEGGESTPSSKRSSNYFEFKNREGPSSIGSRDIPEAVPNSLNGLTFVLSGTLDTIEHDHFQQLVKESGGRITSAVSRKTSYLVVGKAPGQSKSQKAEELGIKKLDEDAFFSLLLEKIGLSKATNKKANDSSSRSQAMDSVSESKLSAPVKLISQASLSQPSASAQTSIYEDSKPKASTSGGRLKRIDVGSEQLVDKYKPLGSKQIIGQQGDRSNMNKFINWLRNWSKWNVLSGEKKQARFNSDDGSDKRAVLFSGPPGVGKTTTANIVCRELGLSFSEFNASDKRNKKSLEETVSELTNSKTMDSFQFATNPVISKCPGLTHVLIMDEIDGMSGNEDRGGMQEVIALIKKSKIPIICICNDRNSQKIRSLANYCFDLRFHRPTVQQIKGAMMSIAFKEGIKLNGAVMDQVIIGANQDVRQVLHRLSMLRAHEDSNVSGEQAGSLVAKDIVMNPFEMARLMVSSNEETNKMTLNEKAEKFFFTDYSLMPLFFQENYLHASPKAANLTPVGRLKLFAQAAELLTYGDLCDRQIRNSGNWSLLPHQAFFSVILPGEKIKGYLQGMVNFPSWLGKNSSQNKNFRLIQEMQNHMSLKTSSSNDSLNMEYLPTLRHSLKVPLLNDNVAPAISICNAYDLSREDKDALFEVTEFGAKASAGGFWSKLSSKTKAAFTRAFNKTAHALPYTTGTEIGGKKRKRKVDVQIEDETVDEEGNVVRVNDAEDVGEESGEEDDSVVVPVTKKPKAVGKKTEKAEKLPKAKKQ